MGDSGVSVNSQARGGREREREKKKKKKKRKKIEYFCIRSKNGSYFLAIYRN